MLSVDRSFEQVVAHVQVVDKHFHPFLLVEVRSSQVDEQRHEMLFPWMEKLCVRQGSPVFAYAQKFCLCIAFDDSVLKFSLELFA